MANVADLTGVIAKVARAEEHRQALYAEIDTWGQANAHRMVLEVGRDGPWFVLSSLPMSEPPLRWALVAGDLIQNLRSALDHLVWQLVLRDGHQPSWRTAFPMIEKEMVFLNDVKLRKTHPELSVLYGIGVDGDAWKVVESAQPFNNVQPAHTVLSLLRRFSNRDKHQTLYVQMAFPDTDTLATIVDWNPHATLAEQVVSTSPIAFERTTEIARYRFAGTLDPELRLKAGLSLVPTFGETQAEGAAQVAVGTFEFFINRITSIVDAIRCLPNVIG